MAKHNQQKYLDNFSANEVMKFLGISTPLTLSVSDVTQAELFAEKSGWPVVLKISSPNLLHKADINGVIVNINNSDELQMAWKKISTTLESLDTETKSGAKIQIQKQIVGGVEVIVGVKKDPNFGSVVLFGAGGKYAEILLDRNLHLLPMEDSQIHELVKNSKIFSLLKGYRDDSAYDLGELYETISLLGRLALSSPDISEIEINPLIITHKGVFAVDCKVVLI